MELDIHYARSSGAAIAYQVVGSGPTDLVFVPEFMSNLVYGWESPCWRQFYERLASFSRLILFDKRGTGLSDSAVASPRSRRGWRTSVPSWTPSARTRRRCLLRRRAAHGVLVRGDVSRANDRPLTLPTDVEGTGDDPAEALWPGEVWERDLAAIRERWGTQEFSDETARRVAPRWPRTRTIAPGSRTGCASARPRRRRMRSTDLGRDGPARRPAGRARPDASPLRGDDQESLARNVRSGSRMREPHKAPETTTGESSCPRRSPSTSSSSWPVEQAPSFRNAYWRRCCSRISSTRPRERPTSATAPGAIS